MEKIRIVGILVKDRIKESGRTQTVLSKFSSIIKNRLGFHEVSDDVCSRVGVIILQIHSSETKYNEFKESVNKIGGVELKEMIFD